MTIQWGDTGKVAYGPLKTINITSSTPRETLLGTPVALPTTEPGSPQISFTIQASDFPTVLGVTSSYAFQVVVGGKNTDAAGQTVSYRVKKNGTQVGTGTNASIPTNTFWTGSSNSFFGAVAGDVLTISLWSSSANVNYDYFAIMCFPSRIAYPAKNILSNVLYTNVSMPTILTQGTPQISSNAWNVYIMQPGNWTIAPGGTFTLKSLVPDPTYGLGRVWNGDGNTSNLYQLTSATNRPYYLNNNFPASISFREVLR